MHFHFNLSSRESGLAPAVATGLLLGLSFPSYPFIRLELLAWVALVPLLLASRRRMTWRRWFLAAYGAMVSFSLVSLWWISLATLPGGLLTVAANACFMTVPLLFFRFVSRRSGWRAALFSLPFSWVGWEWLYMRQELSFGWLVLGNSQALLTPMIQYADMTGVWGITFWLVFFNALVTDLLDRPRSPWLAGRILLLFLMVLLPLGYAWRVEAQGKVWQDEDAEVAVAIVQPNMDPYRKWQYATRWQLMEELVAMGDRAVQDGAPDLILWPETALPFHILDDSYTAYYTVLRDRVQRWESALLTGISDVGYEPVRQAYNASMLLQPGVEHPQVYRKMRLVPFAERVPYLEVFPWLERFSVSLVGIGSWGKGVEHTIMELQLPSGRQERFMNMICYESIFPGLVASFVREGAGFLTLVTNDGWYGKSYGPYQHAAIGRLRCIENRREMARCANTGISQVVDRYGRVRAVVPWWQKEVLSSVIGSGGPVTFYTRYPDLVPVVSLGVTLLTLLWGLSFRLPGKR
ncbi:apolipoprotein N-acyltransferase [Prosthecochloris vibrioformis]|uniref:Apolipoprotein N-acyltransferase n=1 Tax=Prosthecochloris vibrioformis TaxID=1098 RepID=A0A5C4S180_PROVB|nr:apolipoprotein N-acyltransferase [Prosthecochloris vibrioformis]TNJ37263.1 apolipoprotein N-acyltransferase [Prosthecochloris vibrioformis]